jgi:hypothetical protein
MSDGLAERFKVDLELDIKSKNDPFTQLHRVEIVPVSPSGNPIGCMGA